MKLKEILQIRTVSELKEQCMQYQLSRYSKLKKAELAELLEGVILSDAFLEKFFLAVDEKAFRDFERLLKGKKNVSSIHLYPFVETGFIDLQKAGSVQLAEELQTFSYKRFDSAFYKQRKQVQKYRNYFNAFANLYGVIPIEKVFSLLKEYEGISSMDEIYSSYDILSITRQCFYFLEEELVAQVLTIDKEKYINIRQAQMEKPYASLSQSEFLQYADCRYFEKTPQYYALARFLQTIFHLSTKNGESLAVDVQGFCRTEASFGMVLAYLNEKKYHLDEEQLIAFMSLYTDLYNHTRLWSNCGYSPNMLIQDMLRK